MKTVSFRRVGPRILTTWMIALVFLIVSLPLTANATDIIGKITQLKGTATIYRKAVSKPINVTKGTPVHLGDRVKTGADSRLRIELKDGSILSMVSGFGIC